MNAIVKEWIAKAEGDAICLEREWRARKNPVYDAVCFHAQQCAEKYLKACLQEAGIEFDKTHKLLYLLALLQPKNPTLAIVGENLVQLDAYAVVFRYPGATADKTVAKMARENCHLVRKACRAHLRMPE
jgi:HEPN domain-containing protein